MDMWIDMCQTDHTLYRKPLVMQHKICWTQALDKAANAMGYPHYMDIPDSQVEALKEMARRIQIEGELK